MIYQTLMLFFRAIEPEREIYCANQNNIPAQPIDTCVHKASSDTSAETSNMNFNNFPRLGNTSTRYTHSGLNDKNFATHISMKSDESDHTTLVLNGRHVLIEPNSNDVLLGRGNFTNKHE